MDDLHTRLIETSIAAERACRVSRRRITLSGFLAGMLLGGAFGFQAVFSEGWMTGMWFVIGTGLAAGVVGALLASPAGILWGMIRRRRAIRHSGFTPDQIQAAVVAEITRGAAIDSPTASTTEATSSPSRRSS